MTPPRRPEECAAPIDNKRRLLRLLAFAFGALGGGVGISWLVLQWKHLHLASTWPWFVAAFGVYLLLMSFLPEGSAVEWLAMLGAMVTAAGLILAFQVNPLGAPLTHHWGAWVYAWTLVFPSAGGLGLILAAHRRHRRLYRPALLLALGLTLFVLGFLTLESTLGIGHFQTVPDRWLAASTIILGGLVGLGVAVRWGRW